MSAGREALVGELRGKLLAGLRPFAPAGSPYALVDFPDHSNVGDSAIWLGQLKMFDELVGRPPAYVSHRRNCDWEALAAVEGTIFIHGGGNFGDIYPAHQDFREEVLRRFPGRLVVQLPQSLHYGEPAGVRRTAEAIGAHGNFVLCVRDENSRKLAEAFDCATLLLPDSAFFLDLARSGPPKREVVYLHRTDSERVGEGVSSLPDGWAEVDWLDEPKRLTRRHERLAALRGLGLSPRAAVREAAYRRAAQERVGRGVRILSEGEMMVTDRLHAHILATLMDLPHLVLDNSYGKLSRYMAAWGTDRGSGRAVESLQAAIEAWRLTRSA